jgi:hypothetical protein
VAADTGALVGRVAVAAPSAWGAALLTQGSMLFVATTEGVCALSSEGRIVWSRTSPRSGSGRALPGLGTSSQIFQPDFKE